MKNNQQNRLLTYIEKTHNIERQIEEAVNQNEVDRVIELVDNRGRLLNIIELIAKKDIKENKQTQKTIQDLYKKVQHFNECMNPKLKVLLDNLSQQIAQTYKSKVSLRGYKSTNVRP